MARKSFHFAPFHSFSDHMSCRTIYCHFRSHLHFIWFWFCGFGSFGFLGPHRPSVMSAHSPPSEASDSSFWASVYTQEPPNVLCGVLTDLNLHRFTLHQHLSTHRALTETPLLHTPFQQALPEALQPHLQLYTNSIHQIEVHVRRALTALDALGRHPPRVYIQELDTTLDDDSASEILFPTADELVPGRPIRTPPIARHHLPGTSTAACTMQHASAQTTPTTSHAQSTQTDFITLLFHEEQQTTPDPDLGSAATQTDHSLSHATAQTDLHSMVLAPAFATPNQHHTPTAPTTTADSTPAQTAAPPPTDATSLSNKQPNADPAHWQYANFIPTPPVDQIPPPAGPADFVSPIGGTPRSSRSKTPPRSTTPHRTRFSQGRSATQTDIRRGSPAPQPRATSSIPFLPQPSQPPPTQPPAYHAPQMTAAPPASHYTTPPPPVQLPHASPTPSASIPPVTHAWPAPYPTPKPAPPSLQIPQPAPQANAGQQHIYYLPNPQQHRGHVPLHAENYDPANDPWRTPD